MNKAMARIGIIGTGRMGVALGTGWITAKHSVVLGSRNPEAKANVSEVVKGAQVLSAKEAARWAEIVVIAVPYSAAEPFAHSHAADLRGKLVIDITNPFDHLPDNRIAGAEITERAIGAGARVIAAFKDNFAATIAEPVAPGGVTRDVHFAGGTETDKRIVTDLITD